MKAVFGAILALTLSVSAVQADVSGPLAPGKPAGVHRAQLEGGTGMLVLAGAALVGIGIALATAGNGPSATNTNTRSTVTTTSTNP